MRALLPKNDRQAELDSVKDFRALLGPNITKKNWILERT